MGFFIAGFIAIYLWAVYLDTDFWPYAIPMILTVFFGIWTFLGRRVALILVAVIVVLNLLQ